MKISFTTVIKKFGSNGDKTGWTYIEIPSDLADQLKPGTKVSFLVKGKLDQTVIKGISLLPMGGGSFIMPLKAELRKRLHKSEGASLHVQIEEDKAQYEINKEFLECLKDSPDAASNFAKLPRSRQNYFSKWIDSAKTEMTKAKRIAQSVEALQHNLSYSEMIRMHQGKNNL